MDGDVGKGKDISQEINCPEYRIVLAEAEEGEWREAPAHPNDCIELEEDEVEGLEMGMIQKASQTLVALNNRVELIN